MFGGRKKNNECPIGMDVGDSGVRLLQMGFRGRGGEACALAAAWSPLPDGVRPGDPGYAQALASAARSAWSAGRFTTHRVVSALPVSLMQCKNLRLPAMPADELASAVRWEAEDRFRMGPGQCSVQFLHAGQVSQGDEVRQELILLAAKLSEIETHVSALTGSGLRPVAIDAAPTALARLSALHADHAAAPGDDTPARVMIDVGQSATKVLIESEGRVKFYKPIDIGVASLDSVVCGALSLTLDRARDLRLRLSSLSEAGSPETQDADRERFLTAVEPTLGELSREIGLCLRYYGVTFRGARPAAARLVGGGAAPWLAQTLSEASGIAVVTDSLLDPADLSAVRETVRPDRENAWAVAAGLSLRQYAGSRMTRPREDTDHPESVFRGPSQGRGAAA